MHRVSPPRNTTLPYICLQMLALDHTRALVCIYGALSDGGVPPPCKCKRGLERPFLVESGGRKEENRQGEDRKPETERISNTHSLDYTPVLKVSATTSTSPQ